MNTGEILQSAFHTQQVIAYLKEKAPVWPDLMLHKEESTLYAAAWVRFEREGKWYRSLCVESVLLERNIDEINPHVAILYRFTQKCYECLFLYKPSENPSGDFEAIDENQEPESERLLKLIFGQK